MPPSTELIEPAGLAADSDPRLEFEPTSASTSTEPSTFGDIGNIVSSSSDWFRTMLHSFLISYVTVLASAAAWFRSTSSTGRLLVVPILSLPAMYRVLFRPVSRRIAWRSLTRRRGILSTIGALSLGSAAMSAALVFPQALRSATQSATDRNLGPVDEIVVATSPGARLQALTAIQARETQVRLEQRTGTNSIQSSIDGQLSLAATDVTVRSVSRNNETMASALEVDLTEAAAFGGNPAETGLAGSVPLGPSDADVGGDLAADLNTAPGETLVVSSGGFDRQFVVRRVLGRRGLAALSLDGRPSPRVLFVQPGSVSVGASTVNVPVRYVIAYSNRGRSADGWKRSQFVADAVADALQSSNSTISATSFAVKADLKARADASVRPFRATTNLAATLLAEIGATAILFSMLVAVRSRRRDLSVLKASGEPRRERFGAVVVELWAVALLAVGIGTGVGFVVARALLGGLRGLSSAPAESLNFSLRPSPGTMATAFAGSMIIAIAGLQSLATLGSRSDVTGWTRDALKSGSLTRWLVLLVGVVTIVVGGLVVLRGRSDGNDSAVLLGLFVLGFVGLAAVAGLRPKRASSALVGICGALDVAGLVALFRGTVSPATGSATLLVGMGGIAIAVLHGWSPFRRLGGERVRNVSSFAVPAVVALTAAGSLFAGSLLQVADGVTSQVHAAQGRFDMIAPTIAGSVALRAIHNTPGVVEAVQVTAKAGTASGSNRESVGTSYGFLDRSYADAEGVGRIVSRSAEFANDQAVFKAVLGGARLAIVDVATAERLGINEQTGADLQLRDATTGRSVGVTVAAILVSSAGLPDVIISPSSFDAIGERSAARIGALLRTNGDSAGITAALSSSGIRSTSFRRLISDRNVSGRQLGRLLRALSRLTVLSGLLVVASLFTISLLERAPEFATRRMLGVSDRSLIRQVVNEQIPRVLEGLLLGVVVAIPTLHGIARLADTGRFTGGWFSPLRWLVILTIVGVGPLAAVAVTMWFRLREPVSRAMRR